MRFFCLVTLLFVMALPVAAQEGRGARRPGAQQSADRKSGDRQAGDRQADPKSPDRRSDSERPPSESSERRNGDTRQPNTAGLSPIGLPLPRIGLPPSPETAFGPRVPAWEQKRVPAWERPQTPAWEQKRTPAWERPQLAPSTTPRPVVDEKHKRGNRDYRYRYNRGGIVLLPPGYGYFPYALPTYVESVTPPPPAEVIVAPEPPPPPMGALRLEVEPKEWLQVFVDGVFIGTPSDLGDEIELAPGVHRIELRAQGRKPLIFDAEIVNGRSITYRGMLDRDDSAPPPSRVLTNQPPPAQGTTTMYFIAGCYLGNVPPTAAMLRPGCDIGKLTKIVP